MPGIEVGVACSGGATRAGGSAAKENGGGSAPVRIGRGEVVWELRGLTAELARVSARAEDGRSGGSTAVWSSPAFWVERWRVLWRGIVEPTKGRVE